MPNLLHDPSTAHNLWDVYRNSSISTIVNIMVLVALGLLIVEIINFLFRDKLIKGLESTKHSQPLLGAVLGLIPGCGGTLFLIPFYNKGKISFATLTASFISTMGEAAFVLLALNAMAYLWISFISFIVAILMGYLIHLTRLNAFFAEKVKYNEQRELKHSHVHSHDHVHHNKKIPTILKNIDTVVMPIVVASILLLVLPITIIEISLIDSHDLQLWAQQYINISEWIAFGLAQLIVVYYIVRSIINKNLFNWNDRIHTHEDEPTLKHTLLDTYLNILYITVWVWFGITFVDMTIFAIGEHNVINFIAAGGAALTLLIAAGVGVLPGCGPQLVILNMYASGALGGSALVANAIIQDGDAGFPLLANDKKTFMWMKLFNLVPGLFTGGILLSIELTVGLPF